MNFIASILAIIIILYAFWYGKYKLLLIISIFSLMGSNFFIDVFGSRFQVYQIIGVISSVFVFPKFIKLQLIKELRYEYLILIISGIIFGFIIPWEDFNSNRSWSQTANGRTLVTWIKLFSELMYMTFVYIIILEKKVNIKEIVKIISICLICFVSIGIFDMSFGYPFRNLMFYQLDGHESRLIGRLLGFNHEPKAFGRNTGFALIFIMLVYFLGLYNRKKLRLTILVGIIGIALTFSISAYIVCILSIFYLVYVTSKKGKIKYGLLFMFIILFSGLIIYNSSSFQQNSLHKIEGVLSGSQERQMKNEPYFFTRFEVFDRAALNFFFNNPTYLLTGVGPNLISIPSSKYMDASAKQALGGIIVGGPTMGFISVLSRSGLMGVILYLTFIIRTKNLINSKKYSSFLKYLLFVSFIYFAINLVPWLYFSIGVISGQIAIESQIKK